MVMSALSSAAAHDAYLKMTVNEINTSHVWCRFGDSAAIVQHEVHLAQQWLVRQLNWLAQDSHGHSAARYSAVPGA